MSFPNGKLPYGLKKKDSYVEEGGEGHEITSLRIKACFLDDFSWKTYIKQKLLILKVSEGNLKSNALKGLHIEARSPEDSCVSNCMKKTVFSLISNLIARNGG